VKIVNLSDLDPNWGWLRDPMAERTDLQWEHASALETRLPSRFPAKAVLSRMMTSYRAAGMLERGDSVLVSHGPRPAMYGAFAARLRGKQGVPHLAFSFNYTHLPHGALRKLMTDAYRDVDRFVVFSQMERQIYADYFDLPIERLQMMHWAVQPPHVPEGDSPVVSGDYICAIGSQARDMAALVEAMRRLPSIKLVIVTIPECMEGIDIPQNVDVRFRLPYSKTMNILAHSRFMVLTLRDNQVPCGHVTLVSAMHLGKAIVATESSGIADYLQPGVNGELVTPRDPASIANGIERMYASEEDCRRFGAAGKAFATMHCLESRTVDFFSSYLQSLSSGTGNHAHQPNGPATGA
jgi:hypothetical protein